MTLDELRPGAAATAGKASSAFLPFGPPPAERPAVPHEAPKPGDAILLSRAAIRHGLARAVVFAEDLPLPRIDAEIAGAVEELHRDRRREANWQTNDVKRANDYAGKPPPNATPDDRRALRVAADEVASPDAERRVAGALSMCGIARRLGGGRDLTPEEHTAIRERATPRKRTAQAARLEERIDERFARFREMFPREASEPEARRRLVRSGLHGFAAEYLAEPIAGVPDDRRGAMHASLLFDAFRLETEAAEAAIASRMRASRPPGPDVP